jgi:hypothetical protein
MKLILKTITIIFIELINLLTRFNYNYKLSTVNKERLIMKQCDLDLIKFIKKYNNNWQWYSNDRMTKKVVDRLVNRNICIKRSQLLNTGVYHREVKLINN